MGTKERKKRERKLRKEQIIAAAIELLNEKEFGGITMDEIAGHADLSKGTLYFYFNDKLDLFRAIQIEGLSALHEEFLKIIQLDEPGAGLVRQLGKSFLRFIEENPVYTRAFSLQTGQYTPEELEEIEQIEHEILMITTRALQIGIQDGSIKTETDPKILAVQISFCMRGILQFHLSNTQTHISKVLEENNVTIGDLLRLFINALLHQIDTDSKIDSNEN